MMIALKYGEFINAVRHARRATNWRLTQNSVRKLFQILRKSGAFLRYRPAADLHEVYTGSTGSLHPVYTRSTSGLQRVYLGSTRRLPKVAETSGRAADPILAALGAPTHIKLTMFKSRRRRQTARAYRPSSRGSLQKCYMKRSLKVKNKIGTIAHYLELATPQFSRKFTRGFRLPQAHRAM